MPTVLIFAMNDAETANVADTVACAFSNIGWRSVVCDYAASNGSDPNRLCADGTVSVLTLSDAGFDSIPMISSTLYWDRCGDDLDFDAVLGMRLGLVGNGVGSDGNTPQAEVLHPDSAFRQKLYGLAVRAEEILRALAPELVVIQQGGEVISRILLAKTLKLGLPWLIFESPFFSRHILLDPCGQHFIRGHNQIDADVQSWLNTLLAPMQQRHVDAFVADWKVRRASKYDQAEQMPTDLASFLKAPGPVLFVPMQIPDDANVHYGLGVFESLADYYQSLVDALPPDWRAVFKPHPFDASPEPWQPPNDPRFHVAVGANIHDLIVRADAIAVFSSNVGLEALLYGKSVLVGGAPCYGGKGLTLDIEERGRIAGLIAAARDFRPDPDVCGRLLHYLLHDYLIPEGDAEALLRKLARVGSEQRKLTDLRAPFCNADPPHVRALLPLLARYRAIAEKDYSHDDILLQLGLHKPSELLPLSDKDQPTPWLHQKPHELVTAYGFAARLAEGLGAVLDYGCGDGFGSWLLARSGLQVTACTTSSGLLSYARRTWLHRRIKYQCAAPGAVIDGALPSDNWQMTIVIDGLAATYRPDELIAALTRTLTQGGALLIRIADPRRAVAARRFCPRHRIDLEEVISWCRAAGSLDFTQVFYQQGKSIRHNPVPGFDHQWLLFSRGAAEDWRRRLDQSLSASQSIENTEASPTGIWLAALRRRRRWLGM